MTEFKTRFKIHLKRTSALDPETRVDETGWRTQLLSARVPRVLKILMRALRPWPAFCDTSLCQCSLRLNQMFMFNKSSGASARAQTRHRTLFDKATRYNRTAISTLEKHEGAPALVLMINKNSTASARAQKGHRIRWEKQSAQPKHHFSLENTTTQSSTIESVF